MFFQGIKRSGDGKLYVIPLDANAAIPAGAVMVDGLAVSSDGYLYVVVK